MAVDTTAIILSTVGLGLAIGVLIGTIVGYCRQQSHHRLITHLTLRCSNLEQSVTQLQEYIRGVDRWIRSKENHIESTPISPIDHNLDIPLTIVIPISQAHRRPEPILSPEILGQVLNPYPSEGSRWIGTTLTQMSIPFERERKLDGLINVRPLKIDFYTTAPVSIIEYDGTQHFRPAKSWDAKEGNFETRLLCDRKKNTYARQKRIPLLRITGRQYLQFESILKYWVERVLGQDPQNTTGWLAMVKSTSYLDLSQNTGFYQPIGDGPGPGIPAEFERIPGYRDLYLVTG